jgi:hypothetical protein
LLAEKNIPKWNHPNSLWEERQLEEERLAKSTNYSYTTDDGSRELGCSFFGRG